MIVCGKEYGQDSRYGDYFPVPNAGKFLRIDLNIPFHSNEFIPEGAYPVVDRSKLANTEYKPRTAFANKVTSYGSTECGAFYRDTDTDKYTFSPDPVRSSVKVTASNTLQIEVSLRDGKHLVTTVYKGELRF